MIDGEAEQRLVVAWSKAPRRERARVQPIRLVQQFKRLKPLSKWMSPPKKASVS